MQEAHHNAPLREEEKLTETAEFLEQQARASKSKLQIGEGNMAMGQDREAMFDLS
jgi:hypothetical protein